MAMATLAMNALLWLGTTVARDGLQSLAPNGIEFERSRWKVRDSTARAAKTSNGGSPGSCLRGRLLLVVLSAVGWLCTWWKERGLLRIASLATVTPLTSLIELRRALCDRQPAENAGGDGAAVVDTSQVEDEEQDETEVPQRVPAPAFEGVAIERCLVNVVNMAGDVVWGPQVVDPTEPLATLRQDVAVALCQSCWAVRLLHGETELNASRSLAENGVFGAPGARGTSDGSVVEEHQELEQELQLCAVVVAERVGIADSLYAHVSGTICVPGNSWVTAPFSGEHVAFYEATVTRLYDEWTTRIDTVCTKAGRAAGTCGEDDSGSDAEYENVERSGWEPREEVLERRAVASPRICLNDGSGGPWALLAPQNLEKWARTNAVLTFSETEGPVEPTRAGGVLTTAAAVLVKATLSTERERGQRREERCLRLGETAEIVGEAVIGENERVVLRHPELPSEKLHRINSLDVGRNATIASTLANKAFVGAVIRRGGTPSLAALLLGRARWWRLGKWLCGAATAVLAAVFVRAVRRDRLTQHRRRFLRSSVA
eukprot:TRINITY_DN27075_c0_g1_i1.p1 TRINITY_DN27075_c0_g1~~TRINITY_DN27075_c0_g1_i1.p1  ORF type:complete len:545 (+),score=104.83 TRINITY_DN27075_c0_g1_i1:66-1700(+)